MTCKDCVHYEVCKEHLIECAEYGEAERILNPCAKFKNKTDFVEVVKCKDCVSFAYYKEPLKYKGKVWEGKCTVTGDLITDDNFFCRNGIRKMAQQKEGAE